VLVLFVVLYAVTSRVIRVEGSVFGCGVNKRLDAYLVGLLALLSLPFCCARQSEVDIYLFQKLDC